MQRFICFESEGKMYRFEVGESAWIESIGEVFENKNLSQDTLKKIIEESSDEILVEYALTYYTGKLTFNNLTNLLEKFWKKGEDISYGVIEYCTINKKKMFLIKFTKSKNEDLSELARESMYQIS